MPRLVVQFVGGGSFGRMQHQHHFAARLVGIGAHGSQHVGHAAADEGFKRFADFACQHQMPVGQDFGHLGECRLDAVRRFKHGHGIGHFAPTLKPLRPFARFGRQEAGKIKIRLRYPGHAQSRHHRAGSGHRHYLEACCPHARGQPRPGVAHRRRARIRYLRHHLPGGECGGDGFGHLPFVVFAHAHELGADAVGREQLLAHARVFRAHQVCPLQHRQRAQRDVG